jgi:arsenate reductase
MQHAPVFTDLFHKCFLCDAILQEWMFLAIITFVARIVKILQGLVGPAVLNLPLIYYGSIMKKIYHLSTCSTCSRILEETGAGKKGVALQNIKTEKISPAQLDEMKEKAGSYEALFSRRSMKYKEMGLKDQVLGEKDYRRLILEEYTFLKRPVALVGAAIFVGSEKKTVEGLKAALKKG